MHRRTVHRGLGGSRQRRLGADALARIMENCRGLGMLAASSSVGGRNVAVSMAKGRNGGGSAAAHHRRLGMASGGFGLTAGNAVSVESVGKPEGAIACSETAAVAIHREARPVNSDARSRRCKGMPATDTMSGQQPLQKPRSEWGEQSKPTTYLPSATNEASATG